MTKKQAISSFIEIYDGPKGDNAMRHEAWNLYIDNLCKDRDISEKQCDSWVYPFGRCSTL